MGFVYNIFRYLGVRGWGINNVCTIFCWATRVTKRRGTGTGVLEEAGSFLQKSPVRLYWGVFRLLNSKHKKKLTQFNGQKKSHSLTVRKFHDTETHNFSGQSRTPFWDRCCSYRGPTPLFFFFFNSAPHGNLFGNLGAPSRDAPISLLTGHYCEA